MATIISIKRGRKRRGRPTTICAIPKKHLPAELKDCKIKICPKERAGVGDWAVLPYYQSLDDAMRRDSFAACEIKKVETFAQTIGAIKVRITNNKGGAI